MTSAAALWNKSQELNAKYQHNLGKLQFMSYTKAGVFAFETYGDQLEAMRVKAVAAANEFADAVKGKSADEIVAIITGAGA